MIVQLFCRAVSGDTRLPLCKYSQESGVGQVLHWAAVHICLPMPLHSLSQGLESGGRVDCLSRVWKESLSPGGKNSKLAGQAGLNSHHSPASRPLDPGKGGSAGGRLGDSHQGESEQSARRRGAPSQLLFRKPAWDLLGWGWGLKWAMNKRPPAGEATFLPPVGFGDVPFPLLWSS